MSSDPFQSDLYLDDAEHTWSVLTEYLEAFIDRWEAFLTGHANQPPEIRASLPTGKSAPHRLILCELVKVDLEYRWQKKISPRKLEDYFAEFAELASQPPLDLLYEEYLIRQQAGDPVRREELFSRFPKQANELQRLLGNGAQPALVSSMSRTQSKAAAKLQPGDSVDDFDLLTKLGEGAFATVFLARQRSMQRLVALKVSTAKGHEPETLAQLDHDYIVRVFDQRIEATHGLRLLYMQYVAGGTLQGLVPRVRATPPAQRTGRLLFDTVDAALEARGEIRLSNNPHRQRLSSESWPHVVCWLGANLARALDYAHRRGVVHRDIKPANVLLAADGTPKLADFNISFSSKVEGISPAAYFGGSLAYMSPEQLEACNPAHARQASAVDARSDQFALAVLLWELLTGRRPFDDPPADNHWSRLLSELAARRHAGVQPENFSAELATWPDGLADALLRCLQPDPARRFSTAGDFARELQLCLHPQTRTLLHPPENSWRRRVARWPLLALMAVVFLPNIPASLFNFLYNWHEIKFLERVNQAFLVTSSITNSIAFPIGFVTLVFLSRSIRQALFSATSVQNWLLPVRRCLTLGHLCAVVGLALWTVAGVTFPISLHIVSGAVGMAVYVEFIVSLTICGAIAAVYPFFGVTFLCVRCFLPTFVRERKVDDQILVELQRLSQRTWRYLLLGASIPMFAILIMIAVSSENRSAMSTVAITGAVGFAVLVGLFREVQSDLATLQEFLRAGEE